MFKKYISHKEIIEILDNKHQNNIALDFIKKYLYELTKRNKKILATKKKFEA
jgi:hypothetical protein